MPSKKKLPAFHQEILEREIDADDEESSVERLIESSETIVGEIATQQEQHNEAPREAREYRNLNEPA